MQIETPYPYLDSFKAAAHVCQAHGLDVQPPKGASRWSRHMVCAPHDGVPYCIDLSGERGELNPDKLAHGIRHRALTIMRHHDRVKAVYEFCASRSVGDIWVMCGGGCQLQAFFGNVDGYLAILYLSLEDKDDQSVSTLQVQSVALDPLFAACKVPGAQVRTCESVYGRQ